jgi:hypothetical protein
LATPLDIRVAGIKVRVEGPERVLDLINTTLSNVPRFDVRASPDLTIAVTAHDDAWEIRGIGGSRNVMAMHSAMPQVGGAVVSRAVSDVATNCDFRTMRATVIERDGRALAMIGDDWESAVTLATHLHGRGWRFIGSDHALYNPASGELHCVQKSLYINASSVAHLPVRYRRAVEVSPWYVTPRGLWFYAVDPTVTGMRQTWTPVATLAGVIVVDGVMADSPLLEPIDAKRLHEDRFTRLGIDWSAVGVADLRVGSYIDSCDLIEHWFASLGR